LNLYCAAAGAQILVGEEGNGVRGRSSSSFAYEENGKPGDDGDDDEGGDLCGALGTSATSAL
jgi:hypothetical protein